MLQPLPLKPIGSSKIPSADQWLVSLDPASALTFASFRLDLRAGRLLHGSDPVPLRPKTWAVLQYLAARPGMLVTKDDLLDAVWPDLAVTESVLSKSIGELRVALGDSFKTPRLIETVQRRGFRFIAPVSSQTPVTSDQLPATSDQLPVSSYRLPVTSNQWALPGEAAITDDWSLVTSHSLRRSYQGTAAVDRAAREGTQR